MNLADLAGLEPWPGFAAHSVSKAGVVMLTKVLARALAPEVTVNAIAPGRGAGARGVRRRPSGERLARTTPLGRLGRPEDAVGALLYLLEGGDFVTGEVLVVDGGRAPPLASSLGDVAIVGGGCYGTFYAGQLIRAAERGKARLPPAAGGGSRSRPAGSAREIGAGAGPRARRRRLGRVLRRLAGARARRRRPADAIVPSPLMPHLMYEWLVRRARPAGRGARSRPARSTAAVGTPYDAIAPDGTRYVSFADWLCPTHCIEPAICPVIRAPRTWEMGDAMAERWSPGCS